MTVRKETLDRLASIPNVSVSEGVLLSRHTRFGIGGPADVFVQAASEEAFAQALQLSQASGASHSVIGEGTNLIVSDQGYDGIVLRLTAKSLKQDGATIRAQAGAPLQALVDYSIDQGLRGMETMTGIPGSVGAAVYGNAGAYGHSIDERVGAVRFLDGRAVRSFTAAECQFHYRESVFKNHKDWIVLSAELSMTPAATGDLRRNADEIFKVRLAK